MKKILPLALALCMLLGVTAIAEQPAPSYTYDVAVTSFPTTWNPSTYQTATDGDLMGYLNDGFYNFDYNETMDGYRIIPWAAVDFPVDVTDQYIGDKWGITEFVYSDEGEVTEEKTTGRAWKLTIRDDLKWEDGTPIKAENFVNSAKLLLNPKAQNYRADSLYSSSLRITNAEGYAKQGVPADTSYRDLMVLDGIEDVDAWLESKGDTKGYVNWGYSFGDTYDFETKAWTGAAEDAYVESPLTIKELYEFYTTGAGGEYITWADEPTRKDWALDELKAKYTWPETAWEDVGYFADGEYDIVMILDKPLTGFNLHYALTSAWLVNEELYNSLSTETDGVFTNTYGTSVETTKSWGTFKLTGFQSDKLYTVERNDNWFGFNMPENEGRYQTNRINTNLVMEPSTRLEMFLNGQLDVFGLSKDYIEEYGTSDFTYYTEGDSVFAMVFNPNFSALEANQKAAGENVNKTIITLKDFRVAMSLGMNRAEFLLAADPVSQPALAIYSSQIVADPENGIFYRNTDVAKQVVVDFWGLTDDNSWIRGADPLLFRGDLSKKPAFDGLVYAITGESLGEPVLIPCDISDRFVDFESEGEEAVNPADFGFKVRGAGELKVQTEVAHNGKAALQLTKRRGPWSGLNVDVSDFLGQTIEITAWVKSGAESISLNADINGPWPVLGTVDTSSGEWTELKATYKVPGNLYSLVLYFTAKDADFSVSSDIYLDDWSIHLIGLEESFEDETNIASIRGAGHLPYCYVTDKESVDGKSHSYCVTRQEKDATMKFGVTPYIGRKASITLYVKTNDTKIRLGLDGPAPKQVLEVDSCIGDWTKLCTQFTIPEELKTADLYIETDGNADFYVDDIFVTLVH